MSRSPYLTPTDEKNIKELARQRAIRERQEQQYETAKPTARFAYAAHITKTNRKISWLESSLPWEIVKPWYEERGLI